MLKSVKVLAQQTAWVYKREGLFTVIKKILKHSWKLPIWMLEDVKWFFLTLRSKKIFISKIHGKVMYLNPKDYGISKELAIYRTHEPLATKILRKFIKNGMTIIDIGANIGYYVLLESLAVGPSGKIIAIEPDLINLKFLKLNVKKNCLENVFIVSAALGDYNGIGKMYTSEFSNLHSLIATSRVKLETVEVPVYTLDTLMEKMDFPVHLVRMDVEGYETNIIMGARQTLKKYLPILMMELHTPIIGRNKTLELLRELRNLGYNRVYIMEREKDFSWFPCSPGLYATTIDALLAEIDSLLNINECVTVFFTKK